MSLLLDEAKTKLMQALMSTVEGGAAQGVDVLYNEAEQLLKQALKEEAQNAEVHQTYARLLQQQGRLDEAVEQYRQAQSLDPANDAIRLALQDLEIEMRSQQNEAQIEVLEDESGEAVPAPPIMPEVTTEPAIDAPILSSRAEDEPAVEDTAMEIETSSSEAEEYWAWGIYLKDERGNLDGAKDAFDRALEHDPRHRATLKSYSLLLLEQEQYLEAEDFLTQLAELEPLAVDDCFAQFPGQSQPALLALRGRLYIAQEAPIEAEPLLRQALALEPEQVEWIVAYARLLDELGRPEDAVQYLQDAFDRNVVAVALHREFARLVAGLDRYDEVETHIKQALEIEPADPETLELRDELQDRLDAYQKAWRLMALARVRARHGLADEAEGLFKEALEGDPEHLPTLKAYAEFLEQQERLSEAEQIWTIVGNRAPEEAEAHFLTILKSRGENSETLNALARVLIQLDRVTEAETHLRHSLDLEPGNAETLELLVDTFNEQEQFQAAEKLLQDNQVVIGHNAKLSLRYAQLLAKRHKYTEAQKFYKQAKELDPFDDEVIEAYEAATGRIEQFEQANREMAVGWMEAKAGNYTGAKEAYEKALEIDPNHAEALRGYAILLEEMDQAAEAGKYLRRLAQFDPEAAEEHYRTYLPQLENRPERLSAYALLLQDLGRPAEAMEQFHSALAEQPAYLPALEPYITLLLNDGQVKEAEKVLKLALSQEDSVAEIHWHYALLLAKRRQRYDLARVYFERAVTLSDELRDQEAYAQLKTERDKTSKAELEWALAQELAEVDPAEAEMLFKKAYALCPEYVPNLIDYGKLLWQQGKLEEARKYLEEALQIDPYDEDAAQYLNDLQISLSDEPLPEEGDLSAQPELATTLPESIPLEKEESDGQEESD